MDAAQIIESLRMEPHPEGGHFVETWRGTPGDGGRANGTAIYFLLADGETSHWHTVDADEVWLFHAGAALALSMAERDDVAPRATLLGPDLSARQHPQVRVPAGWWQSAETTGAWTLVSCIVVPGFEYSGFHLAPPGWGPSGAAEASD